jgi:hypothetical protein
MTATSAPFQAPTFAEKKPQPCHLEVLERRYEERDPGTDLILLPNLVRLNGVGLWCPEDDPIVVRQITVDGTRMAGPMVVTLRLQARALTLGETGEPVGGIETDHQGNRFAVVQVPGLTFHVQDAKGDPLLDAGFVVVDGMKMLLAGPVSVHPVPVPVEGSFSRGPVVVELPLLVRSVKFDTLLVEKK